MLFSFVFEFTVTTNFDKYILTFVYHIFIFNLCKNIYFNYI